MCQRLGKFVNIREKSFQLDSNIHHLLSLTHIYIKLSDIYLALLVIINTNILTSNSLIYIFLKIEDSSFLLTPKMSSVLEISSAELTFAQFWFILGVFVCILRSSTKPILSFQN